MASRNSPRYGRNVTFVLTHGQSLWQGPQKVGWYRAYINQYMVTASLTFTLV